MVKTLDELHGKMDLLATNQMNLCSAIDLLWQSQGKLLATIDAARDFLDLEIPRCINTRLDQFHADLSLKLDAGLKGPADGVALAIAELRKELLGTPQRGRKHSYRGKKVLRSKKK